jgi:hypothetical protein
VRRTTVPRSAEIQASIDELLSKGMVDDPQKMLSELARQVVDEVDLGEERPRRAPRCGSPRGSRAAAAGRDRFPTRRHTRSSSEGQARSAGRPRRPRSDRRLAPAGLMGSGRTLPSHTGPCGQPAFGGRVRRDLPKHASNSARVWHSPTQLDRPCAWRTPPKSCVTSDLSP